MRIAVLFYGRVKFFERKYLLNVIDPEHEVDIFYSSDNEPQESIDEFIKLYNPISINNDKVVYDVDFNKYPLYVFYSDRKPLHNMSCHFTNVKRAFALLKDHVTKNNINYDLVIVTRIDLFIEKLVLYKPHENTVYIPCGDDYEGGLNDQFAIGNQAAMKFYCSLSKEFPELVVESDPVWETIGHGLWSVEHLLGTYFKKYNKTFKLENFQHYINTSGRSRYTDKHYHHGIVPDPTSSM